MIFSSNLFLFYFLPVVLIIYYLSHDRVKNYWLLLASLFFYAWGEPKNILLMLISISMNYVFALLIDRSRGKARSKICLSITVVCNIGMLFYYKYFNFAVDNLNQIFGLNLVVDKIALPIGISFFTFQAMSYVIDVYRGDAKVQRNIRDLALYISLFPQLIAGPIVRYVDIEEQLHDHYWKKDSFDKIVEGVKLFILGFSKKVLLADQLAPLADAIFEQNGISAPAAWVGAIAYAFQIYFDFCGYSDMACGLGKLMGFEFVQNFNYPYISRSIQEFWRRWHISLSTWFRDYVYIPLGGSRVSLPRTYVNQVVVFFLTGLWHGASWNFIVWGLYYVVFLILERMGFSKTLKKLPGWVQHLYALLVILFGWVFFRAPDLTSAIAYIQNMFVFNEGSITGLISNLNSQYVFCLAAAALFSVPWKKMKTHARWNSIAEAVTMLVYILLFLVAISYMVGSGFSPFLYFRF